MPDGRVNVNAIRKLKADGVPIVVFSLYDTPTARIADACGADILLVGDSVANAMLGLENTLMADMPAMIHHAAAVARGARRAMVVADMPFMSYQISPEDALRNAARLVREGKASAVKLEGGVDMAATTARLVDSGIPVMGHVGLLPQRILSAGGFRKIGKTEEEAERVLLDAKAVEKAGAFSVVLECLPQTLAALVTRELAIPTIGIGAGPNCDGQVQVAADLLGLDPDFSPKHSKKYADLHKIMSDAFDAYVRDVRARTFPSP